MKSTVAVIDDPALRLLTKVCASPDCELAGVPQPWGNFYAKKRRPDGTVACVQSYCKPCSHRLRYAAIKADEGARERQRESRRAWERERRKDGAFRQRMREESAAKRRRAAAAGRPVGKSATPPSSEYRPRIVAEPTVPIGPFREWLNGPMRDVDAETVAAWADQAPGVELSADTVRGWRQENRGRVLVATRYVDAIGVGAGEPGLLAELYGDTEPQSSGPLRRETQEAA